MQTAETQTVVTSETQRQEIAEWLIAWIARELQLPADHIDAGRSLLEYSMSSLTATILVGDLEDWLHIKLPPSLVWDYPSIDAITDYLVQQVAGKQELEASLSASNDRAVSGTADGTDARHLLENLDQLSDAEVDALLTQLASSEQSASAG
jgi:acyl carrier protein